MLEQSGQGAGGTEVLQRVLGSDAFLITDFAEGIFLQPIIFLTLKLTVCKDSLSCHVLRALVGSHLLLVVKSSALKDLFPRLKCVCPSCCLKSI